MTSMLSKIPIELYNLLLEQKSEELPKLSVICGNRPFFIGDIEKSNPNRMLVYCICRECYENRNPIASWEKSSITMKSHERIIQIS